MKKRNAFLAVMLAGVMALGVGAAGCKKKPAEHVHAWSDTYTSDGASGHHRTSTCTDHEPVNEAVQSHTYEGTVCSKCHYDATVVGDDDDDDKKPVVMTSDTAISMTAGDTKTLVAPAAGTSWVSGDNTVATVDSNGVVSAKTAGVAKVTATAGNTVVTCTVIVLKKVESSSTAVTKDPFSFSKSVDIGSVSSTPSTPEESDPNAAEFKVEFSDGAVTQNVANGCTVVEPLVENDGKYLTGWRSSGAAANYDFATPVTSNLVLTAQWADLPSSVSMLKGSFESIAVEFSGTAASSTVSYRLHGGSDSWHQIDSELIRDVSGSVRADIVGIKAGVYDVKVNNTEITGGVPVTKYDRSGYAHFKYTSGIGAYKDDGTLKDNALVIYVTDANKDTVMDAVCAANSDINMFQIPYSGQGKDWKGKNASGIGWWLNNNQYTSNNATSDSNKRPSNTYDATNGGKLGFKSVNRPIAVRFIGTVTTPEGCTALDEDEGGINGDNGHMARMKNLKNITIEGIGEDARIEGWGFHFIAGGGKAADEGKSFEVRNLTFNAYPEDAVGMEGQAQSTKITDPVERCWIHNNTFLPGYCANPKESDKKEGDGSCDFKRGYYFTCSYNYFEYCHKTNLIGSSDKSLQYNMTYHHNIWYQCGSRIPLTRQANVHFYNNYVYGNPAEKDTPYSHIAKPSLSYVHSLRANCYLFSENNYYDGAKQILRGASEGGDGKFYGNTYYASSDQKATVTEVSGRTQAVSNNCKDPTNNTSYATFDTDPNLFYYDATNKKTNALLDDSIGARVRCVLYSGAQGHGEKTAKMQQMNTSAPVTSPSVTKVTKGKGQVLTFSVSANTTLTIDATGVDPQVIRNDGKVYLAPFSGSRTVMLDAGTYIVCSGIKDKEITINSLSVQEDTAAAKAARVAEAKKAIEAIPNAVTRSSGSAIEKANQAYANLITAAEKEELGAELTERLKKAKAAYEEVIVAYAIARIDYIGTVTENSGADIAAAKTAYKAVSASAQSKVTNYSKLTAAETAFSAFALGNLQKQIDRLPLSTNLGLVDSRPAVELAISLYEEQLEEYNSLEDDEKKQVTITNVNESLKVLNAKLAEIEAAEKEVENLATFKELLAETTADNVTLTAGATLKAAYESLTAAQKSGISEADKTKYDAIIEKYTALASKAVVVIFAEENKAEVTEKGYVISGDIGYKDGESYWFDYNGTTYKKPLKLQSTTTISFSTASAMTLTIKVTDASKKVLIDGKEVLADANGVITVENFSEGNHTIKKKDSTNICYLTLMPVA